MIGIDQLTDEQASALEHIIAFINSPDDRQLLLSGNAGSGKTTLINVLLDYIEDNMEGYDVTCTAPTNEAVRIISKKSNKEFQRTIYGLLGLVLKNVDDKRTTLVQKGRIHLNDYDLIIIDEASMINDQLFDRLQQYLLSYKNVKILYSGDDAQLPPVNNGEDKNGNNKQSKVFELGEDNTIKLSEVKRVTENNPILKTVTEIRNTLDSKFDRYERVTSYIEESDTGIVFTSDQDSFMEELTSQFVTSEYIHDNDFVRALAYTNEEVRYLNSAIRNKIFGGDQLEYENGENLIVDSPVTDKKRKNQIVYDTGTRLKVMGAKLVTANNCKDFKVWELKVRSYGTLDGHSYRGNIRVIAEESLPMYEKVRAHLANQAKKNAKNSGGKAWFPYFEFISQFDWVKYSYATTVHKSQGSTFRNVYVVEYDINRLTWDNVERNKLKYVAFTRPSHKLVVLRH